MPSKPPPHIEKPISDSDSDSSTEEFEEEEEDEEEEIEDTPENENLQIVLRTPLQNPNSNSNANSNPPQNAASNPSSDSSEEEEEEGSESDGSGSDSDSPARNRAPTTPAPKVKPVSSKPMNQTPKTPSASASSGSVKRRLETEEKSSKKEPKKKKKEVSELGAGEDEPAKKPAAKVWSDEEEIIILKGMVNFRRRGKDPSHVAAFFDTIKHLLDPDINKIQLQGKLRTLKGKYETNAERVEVPGEDPEFVKQHDAEVYKLSKKVWGPGGSKVNVREPIRLVTNKLCSEKSESESESESKETKSPDNCRVANKKQASAVNEKQKQAPVANGKQTSTVNEKLDSESISEYTLLNASILPQDLPTAPPGLGEVFQKGGWNLMGASTAARLDKRWKNVIIAEAKAYLERIDLVKEQTQEMLDLLQSTDI